MEIESQYDIIAKLPGDVRRTLLFNYFKDPRSIFTLCSVSSEYKQLICEDQKLWEMLLVRDFPEAFHTTLSLGLPMKSFKNAYIRNVIRDETFLRHEAKRIAGRYKDNEESIFQDLIKYKDKRGTMPENKRQLYIGSFEALDIQNRKYLRQREEVLNAWRTGKQVPSPL